MNRILTLVLVLALAGAGAAAGQPAPDQATADAAAITKVLRDAEAGWNAGDIPAYMDSYWRSDQLRFASGGTVSYGWQPVLERYLRTYPDPATMGQLVFADLDVQLTGPNHAVAFGSWRLVRAEDEPHGLFTLLFRRLPEGWRVVADHTSSARE